MRWRFSAAMEAFDSSGRRISLVETAGAGGEGRIYRVAGDPALVAKIFHTPRRTSELESKLIVMVSRPPEDPTLTIRRHRSIAWPLEVLYSDSSGRGFMGFIMPAVVTEVFREAHTYYDSHDRVRRFGGAYTWRHLLIAAHNLASAVSAIHEKHYRVGDLRDTNVLVAPNSLITMIDCDSFQVEGGSGRRFPTRVGTGEYLPPELQSADFRTEGHDRLHSDLFALAVLIFKFLMLGTHPFQAKGEAVSELPSTEAKITAGIFPYARGCEAMPPDYAPPFKLLPPSIQALIVRAFRDGHRDPSARPSAMEWFKALDREGPRLKRCRRNVNHMFGGHLLSCPWCSWTSRARIDPFPREGIVGDQSSAGLAKAAPSLDSRYQHLRSHVLVALADGPLSTQESGFLHDLGAELGLRKVEVANIIHEAVRTAPSPKTAPSAKAAKPQTFTPQEESAPKKRDLSELRRLLKEFEPSDKSGLKEIVAEGVIGVCVALLILLAPVAVSVLAVLGLVPALATAGRIREARRRGPSLKSAASMVTAVPQQVILSMYYAVPAGMVVAVMGAVVYFTARGLKIDAGTPMRSLIALAVVGWLWWLLHRAKDGESFLKDMRQSSRTFITWMLRRLRYGYRHIFLAGAVATLAAFALIKGLVFWWPLY